MIDIMARVQTADFHTRIGDDEELFIWSFHHAQESRDPEWNLWGAVLETAVHDLTLLKSPKNRLQTMKWFLSDNEGMSTFRFVCEALGLDYSRVRRSVMKGVLKNANEGAVVANAISI